MQSNHPARIFATVNGASTRFPDGGRQLIGGWCEDKARPRVQEYVRADIVETLADEIRELRWAIQDWSRPTGANGMTMPSANHPLLVAAEKARIALADYEGIPS